MAFGFGWENPTDFRLLHPKIWPSAPLLDFFFFATIGKYCTSLEHFLPGFVEVASLLFNLENQKKQTYGNFDRSFQMQVIMQPLSQPQLD